MKARNAPDATPGAISGKVTRRNVITPPAPRLCEASSSAGASCISDADGVNEVRMTTMVGPIRNTIAIAASTPNTMRSDSASISTAVLGAAIGLAPPPDPIQHANDHQHGNHENNGECRREWPVIGA